MRRFPLMIALVLGFASLPFAAHAQEEEEPDSMDPVVDGLPEGAADEAREASEFGLETARQAREDGRAFGQGQAEAAREGGDVGRGRPDEAGNPLD